MGGGRKHRTLTNTLTVSADKYVPSVFAEKRKRIREGTRNVGETQKNVKGRGVLAQASAIVCVYVIYAFLTFWLLSSCIRDTIANSVFQAK